jgi:hypothetical protein
MFSSITLTYKLSFCGAAKFKYKQIWFYQTCSFTVNQTQFKHNLQKEYNSNLHSCKGKKSQQQKKKLKIITNNY